jgi:hypothetical protein
MFLHTNEGLFSGMKDKNIAEYEYEYEFSGATF